MFSLFKASNKKKLLWSLPLSWTQCICIFLCNKRISLWWRRCTAQIEKGGIAERWSAYVEIWTYTPWIAPLKNWPTHLKKLGQNTYVDLDTWLYFPAITEINPQLQALIFYMLGWPVHLWQQSPIQSLILKYLYRKVLNFLHMSLPK